MSVKTWQLKAEYDKSITSVALYARCKNTAVAQAAKEIAAKCVSDKRFAIGRITVSDPEGNTVYVIPEEGSKEKAGFVKPKKAKV